MVQWFIDLSQVSMAQLQHFFLACHRQGFDATKAWVPEGCRGSQHNAALLLAEFTDVSNCINSSFLMYH
jgi:hypothetical protein